MDYKNNKFAIELKFQNQKKENPYLFTLVKYLLSEEIFKYFEMTDVEEQGKEFHIYVDENTFVHF